MVILAQHYMSFLRFLFYILLLQYGRSRGGRIMWFMRVFVNWTERWWMLEHDQWDVKISYFLWGVACFLVILIYNLHNILWLYIVFVWRLDVWQEYLGDNLNDATHQMIEKLVGKLISKGLLMMISCVLSPRNNLLSVCNRIYRLVWNFQLYAFDIISVLSPNLSLLY